jgi:HK97 family phage major capsid protein
VTVLLADAVPNFVGLNPRDWANMLKAKAEGSGEYFSAGAFAAQAERLWDVPTVPTPAVPAGSALVGDAVVGATVLVREGVHVLVSDSDQDDFLRNKITLLGEGRFSVVVWQPTAFCLVHLAPPTP